MANLWSGRFSGVPDPVAFEFGSSFRFDRRLFEDDVAGSLAWVEGLTGEGVLGKAEAEKVSAALLDARQCHAQLDRLEHRARASGVDRHPQPDAPRESAETALGQPE